MDANDYREWKSTAQRLRNALNAAREKLGRQKSTLAALTVATDRAVRAYRKVAGDMHRSDNALDAAASAVRVALEKENKARLVVADNERLVRLAEGHARNADADFLMCAADVEGRV